MDLKWNLIPKKISLNVEHIYHVTNYIGSNYYDIALLHVVNRIAPILEVTGYVCAGNGKPSMAGWTGTRGDILTRVEQYVNHDYIYDPVLRNLPKSSALETSYFSVISRDMIENKKYKKFFFENPNFNTEVNFVIQEREGWNILKFYLGDKKVSKKTMHQIGELACAIYPACKRHALNTDFSTTLETRPRTLDRLILLLKNRFPQLTDREIQVCAHTILGQKTQTISDNLDLSVNTVVTYRRRAYDKLAVSNAYSLVSELI